MILAEKFPVSFDLKGLVEAAINIDKSADHLINVEEMIKSEHKIIKQNIKDSKNNIKQIKNDLTSVIQGNSLALNEI